MSMLRTSISAASAYDFDGWDESPEAQYRKAMRLIVKTPALIAYYERMDRLGDRGAELRPPMRPTSCTCLRARSPTTTTPTRRHDVHLARITR